MAYRGNWFERLTDTQGRLWLIVTAILLGLFPCLIYVGGVLGDIQSFVGGLTWQSLSYAVWEQFVCVGMVTGLSCLFRKRCNTQGPLAKALSASVYTVYIIHEPVLIFLCLALKNITLYPLLKFIVVAPIALSLCFLLATGIRKLPLARKIL